MTEETPDKIFKLNNLGRTIGWVKFFDRKSGFGFLTKKEFLQRPNSKEKVSDVFFHIAEFKEEVSISPNKRVEFRLVKTPKGFQAHDAVLLDYFDNGVDLECATHEDLPPKKVSET
jgi:cold shock CspA family protein